MGSLIDQLSMAVAEVIFGMARLQITAEYEDEAEPNVKLHRAGL